MRQRYFDIIFIAAMVVLLSYMWFLHSAILIPHIYLAAALMVLNALVCIDLAKQIKENPS